MNIAVNTMCDLSIENIKDLIVEIRNTPVIIDNDVAKLYGVETKRIIEAFTKIRSLKQYLEHSINSGYPWSILWLSLSIILNTVRV